MSSEVEVDVDEIIRSLLEVRTAKPGKLVKLAEHDILGLIRTVKNIFMEQPMLVEVAAPVKVCGDIHGQYYDMLRLFEYGGFPPESSYLFLGDYVDRGRQGIETICLLFALKIKYPKKIHILRGNHESASITRIYGFYEECTSPPHLGKSRHNIKLWKSFVDCFNCMPVAALIEDKILCMHGGLSPELTTVDQINSIIRPTDIPDTGLLCDLLWADPEASVKMWGESERGVSFVFGQEIIFSFLRKNELDLICRAHQVVEDGYEFFAKKQLVTVFSAPNYCGEFNNSGAMMRIEEDLTCSFQVLRPEEKLGAFRNNRPKTPIKRGGG